MKTTRKILSILLVLAMVSALFVVSVAADEPSAYQEGSATASSDGTYVGIPSDAENVTSLTADGEDEDTRPDLLTGYYVYPSSSAEDKTWTGRREPNWNMTWNKNLYLYAGGGIKGITNNNKTGTDEIGMYRDIGGVRYFAYKIYLGLKATLFENGIGVIPTNGWEAQQNYVMFDVEEFDGFYSVVGLTGTAFNNQASNKPGEDGNPSSKTGTNSVYFQVYGSVNAIADTETECKANDDSFVLLSEIEIAGTSTAEFNVNVADYKTLKLVVKAGNNEANEDHVNSGCNAAWGGASVYTLPEDDNQPGGEDQQPGGEVTTHTVTFVIPGQENTTVTVEHGADVTLPTIPAKAGLNGQWDHDGKAITADITITASYVRTVITVTPGNKVNGLKGATNKVWLSDLYAKDVKDAATHTLVDKPKYVAYSYVQKNTKFPDGRLFSVNVNFFGRIGVYSGDTYNYVTKGTLDANGKTYNNTDIVLGKNSTVYAKGLSLQPNGTVVFDISSLKGDHFYAVVGMTGMANNTEYMVAQDAKKLPQDLTFEVYGSTAETYSESAQFELLASCANLTDCQVGEFNVNIEGYKYLKLVCKTNVASSNNEAAWANLCIYTADSSPATADGFSMTAVAAAIVAATSVVALVVTRKKFF